MTRILFLTALLGMSACAYAPSLNGLLDRGDTQRRGAVEVAVKGAYPSILSEIEAGGGVDLQRAMDAAGVPLEDRPTRLIQLRRDLGLYEANPGALVTAILLYGR